MTERTAELNPNRLDFRRLPRAVRIVASVVIALHVAAVFLGPFTILAMSFRGPSPLRDSIRTVFRPYLEATDLDHGYNFFSPEPGPSNLIRYEVFFDDGRAPIKGIYPNLDEHWPRLAYHRHFMMTEQTAGRFRSPEPPEKPTEPLSADAFDRKMHQAAVEQWSLAHGEWTRLREVYVRFLRDQANHLLAEHEASSVRLQPVRRVLPTPTEVRAGRRLTDEPLLVDGPTYDFPSETFRETRPES